MSTAFCPMCGAKLGGQHRPAAVKNVLKYQKSISVALGWQPIATAPENETVFVFLPSYGAVPANRTGRDWWARDASEMCYPTHWRPMFQSPETENVLRAIAAGVGP